MTRIVAHRGLHERERENTLEAFRGAIEAGAEGVELDVRASADGVLVVHHDPDVGGLPIAESLYEALPGYVPRLDEALEALAGVVVNVEVKTDGIDAARLASPDDLVARVVEVASAARAPSRIVYSSFDLEVCRVFAARGLGGSVGYLVYGIEAHGALEVSRSEGFAALNPHHSMVDQALVERAAAVGVELNVWTVNEEADLARMYDWSVTSVITDRVHRAHAVRALGPESRTGR